MHAVVRVTLTCVSIKKLASSITVPQPCALDYGHMRGSSAVYLFLNVLQVVGHWRLLQLYVTGGGIKSQNCVAVQSLHT